MTMPNIQLNSKFVNQYVTGMGIGQDAADASPKNGEFWMKGTTPFWLVKQGNTFDVDWIINSPRLSSEKGYHFQANECDAFNSDVMMNRLLQSNSCNCPPSGSANPNLVHPMHHLI
ncbi:hypothetical protein Tco_1043001 [Tanacetum coccineum]|uniref:Uncharacterized protein n=1 Tax=Tanacetum coccineum TaxID=301880 RepID=A0ABQ5GKR8_9ASTR